MTALLIDATKEQQKQIHDQKIELKQAVLSIKRQQARLQAQEAVIRDLKSDVDRERADLKRVQGQLADKP